MGGFSLTAQSPAHRHRRASSLEMSLSDAIFESVSAVMTTGGTVIVDLEGAPPAMLLGRLEMLAVLVIFTPVFWRE